jgi:hypothetical protein
VSEASRLKQAVHVDDIPLSRAQPFGDQPDMVRVHVPSSNAEMWLLALRRLKKSFFWLALVPIFTIDHDRRMYS